MIFYIYGSKYCPLMHKYPDFFILVNLFLYGRLFNEVFKHLFVIRGGRKISNQIVYMTRNAPKVLHRTVKLSWIKVNNTPRPPPHLIYLYIKWVYSWNRSYNLIFDMEQTKKYIDCSYIECRLSTSRKAFTVFRYTY